MIRSLPKLPFFSFILLISCWTWLLLQASCGSEKGKESEGGDSEKEVSKTSFISPQSCKPCHQSIVDSFLLTGKGRSLLPAERSDDFARWVRQKPVYDRHRNLYYLPEKSGGDFVICEFRLEQSDTVHIRRERVHKVVGSGNQTVSFFREEKGYLYEMPLTWYRKKGIWDLSPGYENGGNQRFNREIGTECLECHASGYEPVAHSLNRYRSTGFAISCDACHGETGSHLAAMKNDAGNPKVSILKIKGLDPQIQMDICRQCHLEGIKVRKDESPGGTFSPGKSFPDYFEVFIEGSGNQAFGFASHAERLQLSECFRKSNGSLTCTGCHDPHSRLPADSRSFFNGKCKGCHGNDSRHQVCEISKPGKSDCVSCHLRRAGTSDIPHVNSTDHWIRKRPEEKAA
jgi:hypothetical protein